MVGNPFILPTARKHQHSHHHPCCSGMLLQNHQPPLALHQGISKFKIFLHETQVCPLSTYHTNPKKKKKSQYLHVLPASVICNGGFSKWLAPRYVLLSLAMLWNHLNYITTSTYLTVQVHDLINLFRNALVSLCPLPPSPWNLRPTALL
jgi:hypothetical protein